MFTRQAEQTFLEQFPCMQTMMYARLVSLLSTRVVTFGVGTDKSDELISYLGEEAVPVIMGRVEAPETSV